MVTGTRSPHCCKAACNFASLAGQSTEAAPKRSSVTVQSLASTKLAATPRCSRRSASTVALMRSPNERIRSRVWAVRSRSRLTPCSTSRSGASSSRTFLVIGGCAPLRIACQTISPLVVAASATLSTMSRAAARSPVAATSAASISWSVL